MFTALSTLINPSAFELIIQEIIGKAKSQKIDPFKKIITKGYYTVGVSRSLTFLALTEQL